jgi:hypothetical protein
MTGAAPYKTAWLDPDHVRLASYLSWWDVNAAGPAVRGPLPAGEDPWRISGPLFPSVPPGMTGGC